MNPRRIKEALHRILHLDEPPELLARSFAVGVFVAFTPTLGFHTVTVLTLAWMLRLNKAVALTGTLVNNPWTIAAFYIAPTWAAAWVMRRVGIHVPSMGYDEVSARFLSVVETHEFWEASFWKMLAEVFRPYMMAFFVGTTVAGLAAAVITYFLAYYGIKYYRIEKAKIKEMHAHKGR
jgi:hypothetical protein